jgi:hypothetical protein
MANKLYEFKCPRRTRTKRSQTAAETGEFFELPLFHENFGTSSRRSVVRTRVHALDTTWKDYSFFCHSDIWDHSKAVVCISALKLHTGDPSLHEKAFGQDLVTSQNQLIPGIKQSICSELVQKCHFPTGLSRRKESSPLAPHHRFNVGTPHSCKRRLLKVP